MSLCEKISGDPQQQSLEIGPMLQDWLLLELLQRGFDDGGSFRGGRVALSCQVVPFMYQSVTVRMAQDQRACPTSFKTGNDLRVNLKTCVPLRVFVGELCGSAGCAVLIKSMGCQGACVFVGLLVGVLGRLCGSVSTRERVRQR
jgi:hypothetical protein